MRREFVTYKSKIIGWKRIQWNMYVAIISKCGNLLRLVNQI